MSRLVQPFLLERPISATIRVDRDRIQAKDAESRIFAKVARNAAGDLWTLRYAFGVPVNVTLHHCARRQFLVYQPGVEQPDVTPYEFNPHGAVEHFPAQPPAGEEPLMLHGVCCYHRRWRAEPTITDAWYSYDYAAHLRVAIKTAGYGTTSWYLDEVVLAEPPAELFTESSLRAVSSEHERNVAHVAASVLGQSAS